MSVDNSLATFYRTVKVGDPTLAALISEDVMTVALHALDKDEGKAEGQVAAERLRQKTNELSEASRRVLENALTSLGYS